jgi:hypothetical protein
MSNPNNTENINDELVVLSLEESKNNESAFSRFCQNRKDCQNEKCTFAHSVSELKPLSCRYKTSCRNKDAKFRKCRFIHLDENVNEYCDRLSLLDEKPLEVTKTFQHKSKIPFNERKVDYVQDRNKVKSYSKYNKNDRTSKKMISTSMFPELNIRTNSNQVDTTIKNVVNLGYTNFNIEISNRIDTEIINIVLGSYLNFLNSLLNKYELANFFKLDNKDQEKLKFICFEDGVEIRSVLKGKTIKNLNSRINGKVSGWDLINKIQSIIEKMDEFRIQNIVVNSDKSLDIYI